MVQKLDSLIETASQTAGPYVHIGLMPTYAGNGGSFKTEVGTNPITGNVQGEIIEITGSIYDSTGWALRDVLIESWQCDANGIFPGQAGADPNFTGFSRFAADGDTGEFTLRTVKPGSYVGLSGERQVCNLSRTVIIVAACIRVRPMSGISPKRFSKSLRSVQIKSRRAAIKLDASRMDKAIAVSITSWEVAP